MAKWVVYVHDGKRSWTGFRLGLREKINAPYRWKKTAVTVDEAYKQYGELGYKCLSYDEALAEGFSYSRNKAFDEFIMYMALATMFDLLITFVLVLLDPNYLNPTRKLINATFWTIILAVSSVVSYKKGKVVSTIPMAIGYGGTSLILAAIFFFLGY